jgi:hypothetical protein
MNTAVVSKALLAVNQDTEIKNIVKDLPDELIDTLMKYVEKGRAEQRKGRTHCVQMCSANV